MQRMLPNICRATPISALTTVCLLLFSGQEVRADIQTNLGVSRIAPLPVIAADDQEAAPRPAIRQPVDLTALTSPVLLRGDDTHAYRDPTAIYHDGEFHLFYTYNPPPDADGRIYWFTAVSTSRDLAHWTEPRLLTPKDQTRNFSSPGNMIRFGDQWVLCLQTYPVPGALKDGPTRYGDDTARLFLMRSTNLVDWSAPELLRIKGPDVPVEKMGRMIDPCLIEDRDDPGKWWCFFKQNGASRSWSRDLKAWTFAGHFPCGENTCIIRDGDVYVLFHSPTNGIGIKRSKDLINWRDEGLLTLGQQDWPWARNGRLTAGFVLDLRRDPAVGKALMFFHASAFTEKTRGFWANCSLGLAWSDDLKNWSWPAQAKPAAARPDGLPGFRKLMDSPIAPLPDKIAPINAPFPMSPLKRPVFPDRSFNLTDYGAKGDGTTKNTESFRNAIAACNAAGGGRVIVPPGQWFTGPIHLKSHVNLHLQEGAEIHFSHDPQDYLPVVFTRWAGFEVMNYSPLIYGNGCENIAITGPGKLYGHGNKWWDWNKRLDENNKVGPRLQEQAVKGIPPQERIYGSPDAGLRPQFISPVNCRNVLLEGFTIAEPGPFWTIHFLYCENVIARGLTIHTKGGPNTDGINLDSTRNALVEHCLLDVGDDAVCLKSGINEDGRRVGRPTENVVVRNVVALNCHGGIVIGSETSGGVRNVLAYDCVYDGSDVGIRLKSNASRGGLVENLHYRRITMRNIKNEAIRLESNYSAWMASRNATNYPTFRNIRIKDVVCDGAGSAASVQGTSHKPIENLTLENVSIKARTGMKFDWVQGLTLRQVTSTPTTGESVSFQNCKDVVQVSD